MDAVISALSALFAAAAAVASWVTVQLTREMRWEAYIRRVLEALVAMERAAWEIERPGGVPDRVDNRFLVQAQQELARALAFPRVVVTNATTSELLENLRTQDLGPPVSFRDKPSDWAGSIRRDAAEAQSLLLKEPPPEAIPGWLRRRLTATAHRPEADPPTEHRQ